MSTLIDLRTDAATLPTDDMRRAMYDAEVGNDIYGEDPTVRRLEDRTAEILCKDASLLVLTATMGNIVSVLTQTRRGDAIIGDDESHIIVNEGAHLATVCGVVPRSIKGAGGIVDLAALKAAVLLNKMYHTPSKLLCIENTHNAAGGRCISLEETTKLCDAANSYSLGVHLDGARLFNAAVALDVQPSALVDKADSITVGITKGLGCPVGALVVGDKDFIAEARHWRYVIGGAMCQAGCFAAAGLVALDTMIERLSEDHANAERLAKGLVDLGLGVNPQDIHTNIVYVDFSQAAGAEMFVNKLRELGVLVNPSKNGRVRFVTHYGITKSDIDTAISRVRKVLRSRCGNS